MKETKKTKNRKKLAYVRYSYPMATMALLIISMFIPCGSYVANSKNVMSATEQISYSWKTSRELLFGGGKEISGAVKSFEMTVLVTIAISFVLFLASLILAVYFTYSVFRYMSNPKVADRQRAVFLTIVPNRSVSFIYLALSLPLAAFQRILALLYSWYFEEEVELFLSFADPFIIGVILLVGGIVISAVSRNGERIIGIDPFKKVFEADSGKMSEEAEEKELYVKNNSDMYEDISGRVKNEQMEAIRRLLKKNDPDGEEK
jgi:hypothetical protein